MVDLAMLAGSVVGALVPLLIKAANKGVEKAGEQVSSSLFDLLKKRLTKPEGSSALTELASEPQDLDAQAALRRQIRKALEADSGFAAELEELLNKAEGLKQGTSQSASQVSGTVIQIVGSQNTVR